MKKLLALLLALVMVLALTACGKQAAEETGEDSSAAGETAAQPTTLRVAALKGPTAMGMVKLMSDSENNDTASNAYTFTLAGAADEITPKLIKGELDIACVPANLGAVLYNNTKGAVQVLAVNTLGVLYIVENGDSVQSVEDLSGKTIYAAGKGSTPEYALQHILDAYHVDATVEWKSEHAECVAAVTADPNAVALLPQPFVSAAQAGNKDIRIALDLNELWSGLENGSTLITGCVVARKDFIDQNPDAVKLFMEQYKASVDYVNANTDDAASLIEHFDILKASVAKMALPYCNIVFISGADMKTRLSGYLSVLCDQNADAVGGTLPDDAYYYVG